MAESAYDAVSEHPLRFSGVSVYAAPDDGETVSLLEEIELTVNAGEWVNVAGVNGSGKSTLARLLAGLHVEGSGGTIERGFAGETASPMVLQRPEAQLFGETPREEVAFALEWREVPPERMASATERALAAVGLTEHADTGWEGLSGGQKQLAAVAAAASVASPLIVFDEATSMLDDANRMRVKQLAKEMQLKGTAVVWVTQRLDELGPEERVVAMAGGRILYDGDGRAFFFGNGERLSPCEACGLRLPYLASLALELKKRGRLADPLPLSDQEWQEVWGSGGNGTGIAD